MMMKNRHLRALAAAVLLMMSHAAPSAAHEPRKSPDVVYFHVASVCTSEKLGGVTVSAITDGGKQIELGQSTENGLVVIERPRLEGARLLLFCADDHFCAAIQNPSAPAGTETLVLLAPFAMT